ncbi:unnamed protein product [Arctogadus glacialis]
MPYQPSPGCPSGLRVRPDDVRAELNGLSLRPDSFVRPGSSISGTWRSADLVTRSLGRRTLDNRCWLVASGRRRERLPLRSMKEVNQSFPAMLFLDQDAGNGQLKCTASSKANFLT